MRNRINDEYFEWLLNLVCGKRFPKSISYRKLLTRLHLVEFTYTIPNDANRVEDGIDLRYRFSVECNNEDARYLSDPCSVLEVMVALAIRCEEQFMDDPDVGDRTGQWFWGMVTSLGLGHMTDDCFDGELTDDILHKFLYREYASDGKGGLFTIRHCPHDVRELELWYQLCWYLNDIV